MSEPIKPENEIETQDAIVTEAANELAALAAQGDADAPKDQENQEDKSDKPGSEENEGDKSGKTGAEGDKSGKSDGGGKDKTPGDVADKVAKDKAAKAAAEPSARRAWALVSKKDRELREKEQSLKEKEAALASVRKIDEELRADPISFFEKHLDAKSLELLQQRILNGKASSDEQIQTLTKQVETLEQAKKDSDAAAKKKEEEAVDAAEVQKQVETYKTELSELVDTEPYAEGKKIATALGQDLAEEAAKFAGIQYSETEELIDPSAALQAVADFAVAQRDMYKEMLTADNGNRDGDKAKTNGSEAKAGQKDKQEKDGATAKTLKQADATTPSPPVVTTGVETEEDIIAEATEAMKKANAVAL